MLERIQGLPENVLGFTAKGEVTGTDYESVLIPAVEKMLENRQSIRFLYHIGDEFTGFNAEAIWNDAKVGLQHLSSWERVAVVTDVEWVHTAVKAFSFILPGRIRVYSNSKFTEAQKWLSE